MRCSILPPVEHHDRRIVVETARHRINGLLSMPREGYRSRLSDYLNAGDRAFLPLTDVEMEPLDSGESERREFLVLSVAHIVLAMPLDPGATEDASPP